MKINKVSFLGLMAAMAGTAATNVQAHDQWQGSRADSHAPIGVMGDHTHKAGEVMLSYRYMKMDMGGLRDGTSRLDNSGTMVSPASHEMDMHMLGAMYAPNDTVTLMFMYHHLSNEMELDRTMMMTTTRFDVKSSGRGDAKAGALVDVWQSENNQHRVHLNANLNIPIGDIDEFDSTPMGYVPLGYRMQLGSGTWDIQAGATYLGQNDTLSWGAQALGTVRTGENDNDYTLGDRFDATAWVAKPVAPWASVSLRVSYENWDDIDGENPDITTMMKNMNPAADPDKQGGQRLNAYIGLNLMATSGALKGHRLALEYSEPVSQDLDGPQLEVDSQITLGWQNAF